MKRLYWRVPRERESWALTFDDGPHPVITPRLLDVLAANGTKATFFLLGRSARRWPCLVQQIAEAGHFIASHGYWHSADWWRGARFFGGELDETREALAGHLSTPLFFRPPHGFLAPGWWKATAERGYRIMMWNLSSYDWRGSDGKVISERVTERLSPGRIALFHECRAQTGEGYHHTVNAVEHVLAFADDRGLTTETPADWGV